MRAATAVVLGLLVIGCTPSQEPGATEGTDARDKTPSDFVRFVREGDGGHLDTAITTYRNAAGVELILFGAVHIADPACYETLNDRFTRCDALLYELVGPENYRPKKGEDRGFNPISLLQNGLKNSLELGFQLDGIDYSAGNFVHADMTKKEFEKSMEERGESLLSIMWNMMQQGMARQLENAEAGTEQPYAQVDLVKAFQNGEGRHTLRMLFASQLEEIETMAAGKGEKGSTLLEGRNEKCLAVLQREIAAGKKKLGIYYGAAHLPHMERRLVEDLGFKKVDHEWLVAWDCRKRPDKKLDRELLKLRRRAKGELDVLAAAGRDYRREVGPDGPPGVAAFAALPRGSERWYAGPVQDPWGTDYVLRLRANGVRWEAVSAGEDRKIGTDDDLVVVEPRRGL
jgi:hypothetical protein